MVTKKEKQIMDEEMDKIKPYIKLIASGKINIDIALNNIQKQLSLDNKLIKANSAKFKTEFNEIIDNDNVKTFIYISILHTIFNSIIKHYFLGNNSLVIIELHAILERGCLNRFPKMISKDKKKQKAITSLIERKTLPDLIEPLIELGIWDETDRTYAKRIGNLRNGIAHKNITIVSKHLFSGNPIDEDEIISKVDKKDSLKEIFGCFKSFVKLL